MTKKITGANIRQGFIDFFEEQGHTFVPSSSLVPGGDSTLLFTNAGMVQFKDVFLGTDKRPYTRATNSQKCMRVAGKHNDLDDVGRDDTHHTFFEMLGNWSFGDYYKKEAISWAWQLLTEVWALPKESLWATCFRDDQGDIPADDEAAEEWRRQPGIVPSHILFFGREENYWEMADTGPSGPCSEIHIDRGPKYCEMADVPGHECRVNGECQRFLELWNLVFIQYDRLSPTELVPLPAKHVDTGLGLERIVSVLQGVDSNYKTDLLSPMMDTVQRLTGDTDEERLSNLTPYRVIADHARAATFLIADGVVPGNIGRNYVCRMIIRRAARFGNLIGLDEPFLATVAEAVIDNYGDFYPELVRHQKAILDNITREEERFKRTLEAGLSKLDILFEKLQANGDRVLAGEKAFDLYATYGLPLEITRDIAREHALDVDEQGFRQSMETHRLASGAGEVFGTMGAEGTQIYHKVLENLQNQELLGAEGVIYDPYSRIEIDGPILSLIKDGKPVERVYSGDAVEVIIPETCFYIEAGGQVSDTGTILSIAEPHWQIRVEDTRKPIAGIIVHIGEVLEGTPQIGDLAIARVETQRRHDIMRNHTATHLLHHELRSVLGEHARQAGSLVAPDRLRFDFTHHEALTFEQLEHIEAGVNRHILDNYQLNINYKPLQQAIAEGATALFGEKYADTVRNITIGDPDPLSNELCGGTHVKETGDIGVFLITSEGSAAAGIRRIEAVTGRGAYDLIQQRFAALRETAHLIGISLERVPEKAQSLIDELTNARKRIITLREDMVSLEFTRVMDDTISAAGVNVLTAILTEATAETMRQMIDRARQNRPTNTVAVLGSVIENRPIVVAAVTQDLTDRGLHAGELVKYVAKTLGGGGGGKATIAQAGGKDASKLEQALDSVPGWVESKLTNPDK
ncbi:MAG: alanine--tRNA ligase [Anaerolineales bacterium]|nr:alanine--tRNA ligase [Anaerolineales bacterium]